MKTLPVFFSLFLALVSAAFAGEGWLTDIPTGLLKAKKEHKVVLVEFTGSDWCPPCMMMHREVFSKASFVKKASKNFVLVKIDIPRSNPALYNKNKQVIVDYKVAGVPTVLLLDAEGKEITRFSASRYNTVKRFIDHINAQIKQ